MIQHPHRRKNILTNEWVLVSPHRTQRPWNGKEEDVNQSAKESYDSTCYLCPGNTRANGKINPIYKGTYTFINDFSAIYPQERITKTNKSDLFISETASGIAKVICFSEDHSLTMASMSQSQILDVIDLWVSETNELSRKYEWVQIFENKGDIMGCSNPHPHGQIWASNFIPTEAQKIILTQKEYFKNHSTAMLLDYCKEEVKKQERVVVENEDWAAIVPYWATWPYETILLPKKPCSIFKQISPEQKSNLASILPIILKKYNQLFNCEFPYSMGWHNSPSNREIEYWQLHAHFYPPLLRSASIKKHMVGYELLAEKQRDITPELAAQNLREL
jgi:UDPglucose--hexose-1-phosphate uridylyltransferase